MCVCRWLDDTDELASHAHTRSQVLHTMNVSTWAYAYVYVCVCIPIGMCMCVYAYRSVCVYLCVHTDELASHVHTKSHARFIRPVQTILMRTGKPESASSGRTTSELGHVIGHTAVSKETQCRCKGDILGSKRDLLHTGIPGPCYRAYSSQSLSSSQRSRVQYQPLG
jgi:hypothetical protein